MTMLKKIEREKQIIARCENSLALEKLKKRRAETRRKIELGGLVVKSGMDGFNKSVVLGALAHASQLMMHDDSYHKLFDDMGSGLFLSPK